MMKKILIGCFLLALLQNNHVRAQEHTDQSHESMDHHDMTMRGMYGNYVMTRESSGTSWVPESSPMEGMHFMRDKWMFMVHGLSSLTYDKQVGPLGGSNLYDTNYVMFMAQKNFKKDIASFRSMLTLEPFTIGKCGYHLLFQTGETCNGKTPLLNRQHPHDLFMELAVVYTHLFNDNTSGFLYAGLPAEPALGPPVFMHRFASEHNPEAPIGHHWQDSTHVAYGVLTGGIIYKTLKCEISTFKGRDPDQHRYDIEAPKFDSFSFRISHNPTKNLALQASYGFLKSPEQLEPNVNVNRYTFSAMYNQAFDDESNWQTIAVLGINQNKPGSTTPSFLLDSTFEWVKKHMFFGRFESIVKDELFVAPDCLAGKKFLINKFTFGYVFEFCTKPIKWGIGAMIDLYAIPSQFNKRYKIKSPSYALFLQTGLVEF